MKADPSNNHGYNKNLQSNANKLRKEMTKAEACLWKYVLKAGLMKGYSFRRQRPVLRFIADFMCLDLKLIIEVEGITHHYDDVMEKDKQKQSALENAGFTVMRFSDNEVLNQIGNVRRRIEFWIEENNFPPPSPRQRGT